MQLFFMPVEGLHGHSICKEGKHSVQIIAESTCMDAFQSVRDGVDAHCQVEQKLPVLDHWTQAKSQLYSEVHIDGVVGKNLKKSSVPNAYHSCPFHANLDFHAYVKHKKAFAKFSASRCSGNACPYQNKKYGFSNIESTVIDELIDTKFKRSRQNFVPAYCQAPALPEEKIGPCVGTMT
jgi:hypothetical protein